MSTASRMRSPASARRRTCGGYSYLESILVLTMTALIAWVVERTMVTTSNANAQLEAVRACTDRGQRLAYELRDMVSSSRLLYGRDARGLAYLAACDRSRAFPAPEARLPLIDGTGLLVPDATGETKTGNVLLFVREADAAEVVVQISPRKTRLIDVYRMVCVYPTVTPNHVVKRRPLEFAWDLAIWRSQPYPSHAQIMDISNATERSNAIKDLVNQLGLDVAWDVDADADEAFFAMDSLGTIAGSPMTDHELPEDLNVSSAGYFVPRNLQLAPTWANDYQRKAWMSDPAASWTPHGLELKMVGPSGSRKIWMRLTVEAPAVGPSTAVHASQIVASSHDL